MIKRSLTILLASASFSIASTKSVYKVWQPLSLHGTDVESVIGAESGIDYAAVMSRPVVLSDALPEGLVYAMGLKHKIASVGGYDEVDANLVSLYQIKLDAVLNDGELLVTIDLNSSIDGVIAEVSLSNTVKLTIDALKLTLEEYGAAYLESSMPCVIEVAVDTKKKPHLADLQKFSTKFVAAAEKQADSE